MRWGSFVNPWGGVVEPSRSPGNPPPNLPLIRGRDKRQTAAPAKDSEFLSGMLAASHPHGLASEAYDGGLARKLLASIEEYR